MDWKEAIYRSMIRTARRVDNGGPNGTERIIWKFPDGEGEYKLLGQEVRKAPPEMLEGYTDWEPAFCDTRGED